MAGKWPARLAWVFLILCFLWSGYVTWNATEKLLDGDASSEMVLSSIVAEDGGILTTRWHYSTELRVLYTQLVFAPLFHVFRDWHMIRFVGTMILQALLLISYGYYCRSSNCQWTPCLIGAGLLLMPRSITYGRMALYQSGYLPHLTFNFLLLGLFVQLTEKKKWNGFHLAVYLALSFGVGLNGIRHGMITFAPLLLTAALYALRVLDRKPKKKTEPFRLAVTAFLGSAFWLAGFLVNSRILSKAYVFENGGHQITVFPTADQFVELVQAYFRSFGYDIWYTIFSVRGILAILGFLAASAALLCVLSIFREEDPDSNAWLSASVSLSAHAVNAGSVLLLFPRGVLERLMLPAYVLTIPTLLIASFPSGKNHEERKWSRISLSAAILSAVLLVGLYHSLFFVNPASRDMSYGGSGFNNKYNVPELEDVVDYLEREAYTLGYAPFWQAAVIREMSDGKVKTLAMKTGTLHYNRNWLNEWQLNDPEKLNAEKHFLVASNDDTEALEKEAALQFSGSDYSVWTFDTGDALWRYVN